MKIPDREWVMKNVMAHLGFEGMCNVQWVLFPDGDPETDDPDDIAWNLYICETPTELMGGKDDGTEVYSGFSTELDGLIAAMSPNTRDGIPTISVGFCCEVGLSGDLGTPHVTVSGVIDELVLVVYIFTRPLTDVEAGRQMWEDGSFCDFANDEEDDGDNDDV